MKPTALIIRDSTPTSATDPNRLTTFVLTYNRFVHSEFMTHRMLSKNSASSRAIPFARMVRDVIDNPAFPLYWGTEQKGMQSGPEPTQGEIRQRLAEWYRARDAAVAYSTYLHQSGIHKSICNRLLEPFAHMTVICTGTRAALLHFFALRAHPDAQPEIQCLAYAMIEAYLGSGPALIVEGQWHVPFGDKMPEDAGITERLAIATARCARVSYLTHDGALNAAKDLELHERLLKGTPPHASPFEHCAMLVPYQLSPHGNFGPHWRQYRKDIPNEMTNPMNVDLRALLAARPAWAERWK